MNKLIAFLLIIALTSVATVAVLLTQNADHQMRWEHNMAADRAYYDFQLQQQAQKQAFEMQQQTQALEIQRQQLELERQRRADNTTQTIIVTAAAVFFGSLFFAVVAVVVFLAVRRIYRSSLPAQIPAHNYPRVTVNPDLTIYQPGTAIRRREDARNYRDR